MDGMGSTPPPPEKKKKKTNIPNETPASTAEAATTVKGSTSPSMANEPEYARDPWIRKSMVVSGSPKRWDRWHFWSPNWEYIPLIYHL